MRIMLMVLMLSGCAAVAPLPERRSAPPQDRAARIAAECRLLEAAHAATRAEGLAAPPDILTGCPGHEHLRDTMPLRAQSAALRTANAARLPPAVAALGPQAARIYRRMITRGVPEPVAARVAQGPLLAAAAGG